MKSSDIPVPENWPDLIQRAMIHAVSLAHFDIICAWSRAAAADYGLHGFLMLCHNAGRSAGG